MYNCGSCALKFSKKKYLKSDFTDVIERCSYNTIINKILLYLGLIRVLHKQLGSKTNVNIQTLRKKWRGLSLELDDLDKVLRDGGFKVRNCSQGL